MATTSSGNRVYAAAHFALELDGKQEVSLFRSIEGGGVKADVMTYQFGDHKGKEAFLKTHSLGKPKFEDIKLQVGMSMSIPFYFWMKAFFAGDPMRKNGAIIAADFYYKERARRTFTDAMISELTFPKLDGSDKNACYMNITMSVESITFEKGTGHALPAQAQKFDRDQKHWTANNFELTIAGLEDACKRVTKVDAITIKQKVMEHHVGGQKAAIKVPSPVEFPNITFYVPEADAQPFMEHMMRRVGYGKEMGNGQVRDETGLHGTLQTYDNEMFPLFSLTFEGCDILSVTPDKADAGSDEIKLVKIEMYTEKIDFKYEELEPE